MNPARWTAAPLLVLLLLTPSLPVGSAAIQVEPGRSDTWTFDSSDHGFAREQPQSGSSVSWDSTAGDVRITSQRTDAGDEMLVRRFSTPMTHNSGISLAGDLGVTAQGHYQSAWPLFLSGSDVGNLATGAPVAAVEFLSLDQAGDPAIRFLYRGHDGVAHRSSMFSFSESAPLHASIQYAPGSGGGTFTFALTSGLSTVGTWSHTVSTGSDDFVFSKVGFAAEGRSHARSEPVARLWVDDVDFDLTINPSPNAPGTASSPIPADGATHVPSGTVLEWTGSDADGDALAHRVFHAVGRDPDPSTDAPACDWSAATQCDPGALVRNAEHRWLVQSSDGHRTATGPVWTFHTTNQAPTVGFPVPDHGATGVSEDLAAVAWSASDPDGDSVTSTVRFGTTDPPTDVLCTTTATTCDLPALTRGATYHWSVHVSDGIDATQGAVWYFQVAPNQAPVVGSPDPANGANDVAVARDALSWSATDADGDDLTATVRFGTSYPPATVLCTTTGTSCDLPALDHDQTYHWNVEVDDGWTTTLGGPWSFSVQTDPAPSKARSPSPGDGATDVPPVLSLAWAPGVDPDGGTVTSTVTVWASDASVAASCTTTDTLCDVRLAFGRTYTWRVDTTDPDGYTTVGDVWTLSTRDNQPPPVPTPTTPSDGATGVHRKATLRWSSVSDPDGHAVSYRFYLNEGTGTPTALRCSTSYTSCFMNLKWDKTYSWRVRAVDELGRYSDYSPTQTFTTAPNNVPSTAHTPRPADGATDVSPGTDLYWGGGHDSDGDYVQMTALLYDADGQRVWCRYTTSSYRSCDPGPLEPFTTYTWRVFVSDNTDYFYGPTWTFTTGAPDTAWLNEHLEPFTEFVLETWDEVGDAVDDAEEAVDDAGEEAMERAGDLVDING